MLLSLPEHWVVNRLEPNDAKPINANEIEQAFRMTIATPRLRDLAKGKHTATIAVDDITRPTPTHHFLPKVISELVSGGIDRSNYHYPYWISGPQTNGSEGDPKKTWPADNRPFQSDYS
ncbi:DUF2088 domain-containing protein [bacterium]|nr:DUF2088 domain-containing protein [bacterium]